MRIALLADVHANREALSACFDHMQERNVDRFVFLGDMIGYGADPDWVIDTVMEHAGKGAIAVLGNHEDMIMKGTNSAMPPDAQKAVEWTTSRLTAGQLRFIAKLPLRVEENNVLYVHANAWAPGQWDYIATADDAQKNFTATALRYTFFGHIHAPALYHQSTTGRVDAFTPVPGIEIPLGIRRWLVNPGSVGQPRDGAPAACYAIYDSERGSLTCFRVPFDVTAAARKIREAGLPRWFSTLLDGGT